MLKIRNKIGIALASLTLVIIVILLLAGITTYTGYDLVVMTKRNNFAKDLTTISDAVEEYYIVNGDIPILSGGITHNKEEYLQSIETAEDSDLVDILTLEISNNNDENATFYELDLTKLGIENIKYGAKVSENDLFLISSDSHKIYYYHGLNVGKKTYFTDYNILEK